MFAGDSGNDLAALAACGSVIQDEPHAYLKEIGVSALSAGTVVRSPSGSLPFGCILHAVAIDPLYDSSVDPVRQTVCTALESVIKLGAKTIASPTLATGYGPLSIVDFGKAAGPLSTSPRLLQENGMGFQGQSRVPSTSIKLVGLLDSS